jgi:hypothetical protein
MIGINKIMVLGGTGGGERVWYTEGTDCRDFMSNWNYSSELYNMTRLGPFGNSWVHGWGGSPRTYELTLNNIPSHTAIRYTAKYHLVDSWDNEYNEVRITNGPSNVDSRTYASWRKTWNRNYIDNASVNYGATINFITGIDYSYEPWNGSNDSTMGYVDFDSDWQDHNASSIRIYSRTDLNQGQSDEAYYISHATLWIR